ncbi:MAG: ATP-dependent RNA helicase HrpA [Desulfobacteraceae bacterium]|nr:ATP-dependent RNA helicase HrpA [Desulfobacteraceae bacterium]
MQPLKQQLDQLQQRISQALYTDQVFLRRQLKKFRKNLTGEHLQNELQVLSKRLDDSIDICQRRRNASLRLEFDKNLPITAKKDEILETIGRSQVVIIAGETGSGKTTQLPKLCLAAQRGIKGAIAVTQPRRIAATSISQRIADEIGEVLGHTVGFKIRFRDSLSLATRVKIVTDGILLSEAQTDRLFFQYDTIIVDEAHERSLNIDFILGLLKKVLKKRKELKLIITSATIDTEKFSRAFEDAPVIQVSGRMFPVQTRYFASFDQDREDRSPVDDAVAAVEQLYKEKRRGDILIFMPTEQDIRDTCDLLEARGYRNTVTIALFARLAASEQRKVFAPSARRKIIVATNVAETSITIPGIQFVIDTGLARISKYTPRSRTTTLPVLPISQSNADQRQGRCGRVANGMCIRLFSEQDYLQRPRFAKPEILRSNLAEVILRMLALKIGDVDTFPFIDSPAPKSIQDGYQLLLELGAITAAKYEKRASGKYRLTSKGKLMARLPLDPRLSCILLEAHHRGCLDSIAIIASALSIQDPRERPMDKQVEADKAQERFSDPLSDFVGFLRIWHAYQQEVKNRKSWANVKRFCHKHFLSFNRMREWQDVHRQILSIVSEHGLGPRSKSEPFQEVSDIKQSWYIDLHKSILSGFLSNIGMKKEKQLFQAPHNRQVMVFPGSGVFKNPGNWIVAAQMVETSRLFARCVAVIEAAWLEQIGKAQCKYSYSDPRWEKLREQVVATEQVSLYGLIIDRRPRAYGPINPDQASEIFYREALINGDVRKQLPFMKHNMGLVSDIQDTEAKLRRRDLLLDEYQLMMIYRKRLGPVYDMRSLHKKIKSEGGDSFLFLTSQDLMNYTPDGKVLNCCPDHIEIGDQHVDCSYHYTPGKEKDGISVCVPAASSASIPADGFQWMVPGFLKEKILALMKGLPKELRKKLVPLADTASIIAGQMPLQRNISLATALSRFIHARFNVDIPASSWDETQLPDHLRMLIAVTDDKGRVIKSSRDSAILSSTQTNGVLAKDVNSAIKKFEKKQIKTWDFGDLQDIITIKGASGKKWQAYPGLEIRGDQVVLTAFVDPSKAKQAHCKGVRRLLENQLNTDLKYLRKNLKLPAIYDKVSYFFGGRKKVEDQLAQRIINDLLSENVRSKHEYDNLSARLKRGGIVGQGQQMRQRVCEVLDAAQGFCSVFSGLERTYTKNKIIQGFLNELRKAMDQLIPGNFIMLYSQERLGHVVRYLKALTIRAQRGALDFEKDRSKARQVEPFEHQLAQMIQSLTLQSSDEKRKAVEDFYWILQEYKVSIFAQEIKTAFAVSGKKLRQQIKQIQRMV